MCCCTFIALPYFLFEDNFQVQALGCLHCLFGGAIKRRVFCVTSLGGGGGGLYMEGLIFGSLWYSEIFRLNRSDHSNVNGYTVVTL